MRAGPLAALLLAHAALVLGGVYYMLTEFGDELDRRVDEQVTEVQEDVERRVDRVERRITQQLRRELDARLGSATP